MAKSVKEPMKKPDETKPPAAPAAPKRASKKVAAAGDEPKPHFDLRELASAIMADAVVPTIEQIKALAETVIGTFKPAKSKKAKAGKGKKDKKATRGKSTDKPAKKAAGKAAKKGKAPKKKADAEAPKIRLPKLRSGSLPR